MPSVVISWIAWYYDFLKGEAKVNTLGPTYDMHQRFFDPQRHEKHLLLSTGAKESLEGELLLNRLSLDFPTHKIELHCMDIQDIFDFQELRLRSMEALEMVSKYDIDILYSNGTTPMRMVWLILHLEKNGYATRLIQGKERRVTGGEPQFQEIEVDSSLFAYGIHIRALEQDRLPDQPLHLQSLFDLYYRADRIADVPQITTLIEGESGTGKEIMARYIHEQSAQKKNDPVIVNCAAMGNGELLESRLFGHEKGVFTGADQAREGLFKDAHKSTIFLDEIGDIGKSLQQALLRVLQERVVTPVGASHGEAIAVRVIAATNKNLWEECQEGRFRWDLYYRLTQTRIKLPPFRRYSNADKWAFIHYFLLQKANTYDRPQLSLSKEVKEWLFLYHFPGNLRELENLITHFYVFADGLVKLSDLPEDLIDRNGMESFSLEEVKKRHILQVFKASGEQYVKAAKLLGITHNTLKKYVG